ncbi:two-component system sensor histidine kinase NtrB [Vulgatibacter sp.]|uniref:two-component system sensor histidine kinase NtrB n=1 Tax=Vulgatibacter sp. TaxID=1971226 RepID=UPI0035640035
MLDANAALPAVAGEATAEGGAHHLDGEQAELHRRLLWLAAFRVAAVTVLVGTTAVITFKGGEPLGGRSTISLSSLAVGTNLLQIGVVLLLRLKRRLRELALVQIVGDVAFAAALVYLTGGAESLFTFLYLLAVVNGGILLARQGAWFAASAAFFAHITLVLVMQFGWIAPAEGNVTALGWADLYQVIFTHGAAFGLTAVVASYVAGQLERAGARAEVAEESLSKLGALHDAIVRSISSGIVTTDEDHGVSFINRAGEDILGTRFETLRGEPLDRIFPVLGTALGRARDTLQRLECTWQRPDGSTRVLGFTINPLIDGEGRRLGTSAVFQDLTPFRDLEARAARSERLATVGELSAGLAHELRNPLASMSGSIEMLAASRTQGEEDQRLFDIVLREADRLNSLVTDFLAFARPAAPEARDLSLPELLGEVMHVFSADPRLARFRLESEIADAHARIDPAQIKQVLWNLLLNAAQASGTDGTLVLRCGPGQSAGTAFIAVQDAGCGIEPELLARIFDPFFTTKAQGTGLGLATVHRIVESHGGQIEVQSTPGVGTCFTLVLPAPAEES